LPNSLLIGRVLAIVLVVTLVGTSTLLEQPFQVKAQTFTFSPYIPNTTQQLPFEFERNLSVTNPFDFNLTNQPILLHMSFPKMHLLSALQELRVYNSSYVEIPSWIYNPQYSGTSIVSVWLIFLVSMQPNETQDFEIFYGDPTASVPTYRDHILTNLVNVGSLSIETGEPSPGISGLGITYASTYIQSLSSKITYQPSGDFGSVAISTSAFVQLSGWREQYTNSVQPLEVVSSVYQAGSLQLTRTLFVFNNLTYIFNFISNPSNTSVNGIVYGSLVDSSNLTALGPTSTFFDGANGILYSQAGDAFLGYTANLNYSGFDVDNSSVVYQEMLANTLSGAASASGPASGAVQYSIGSLQPGETASIVETLTIAPDLGTLKSALLNSFANLNISLGPEEIAAEYSPSAVLILQQTLTNISTVITPSGILLPVPSSNMTLLPQSFSFTGVANYSEPSANFSTAPPGTWLASAASTGNATAYASSRYYSAQLGASIGRLAAWVPDSSSGASLQLLSKPSLIYGSSNPSLVVDYKAIYVNNATSAPSQIFYLAIDYDPTLKGNFSQSLLFPLAGSFVPANSSVGGSLLADDSWHTLSLNLGSYINSSTFLFRIRAVISTTTPYVGQSELDLQSAFVSVQMPATNIVVTYLDSRTGNLELSYGTATYALPSATSVLINASYTAVQSLSMTPSSPTSFSSSFTLPVANSSLQVADLSIYNIFPSYSPLVSINGTQVSLQTSGPVVVLDGNYFNGDPSSSNITFTYEVPAIPVALSFTDSDGALVPGVAVTASPVDVYSISSNETTNQNGTVAFKLLPAGYQIYATYQGQPIYFNPFLKVSGPLILNLNSSIYQISVEVQSASGNTLPYVPVSFATGNYSISGLTDVNGRFTFQAAAGAVYLVTVTNPDGTSYQQSIRASANNILLIIQSPYRSDAFQLIVGAALAGSVIITASALLIYTRRPGLRLRRNTSENE
jgi:hypothetical protein